MKFSIGAIFCLTALVALLTAILFVFPDVLATLCLMILNPIVSAALLTSAIYGRQAVRAFSIGAAGPTLFMTCFHTWLVGISGINGPSETLTGFFEELSEMAIYFKIQTVLMLAIALCGGLTGVAVRWLLRPTC